MMIYVSFVRQAYQRIEICHVGFVRTSNISADVFAKICKCEALIRVFFQNLCDLAAERWIQQSEV